MPDGSIGTSLDERFLEHVVPSVAQRGRRGGEDTADTGLTLFHVAQAEMEALAYGQEEIAEFLSDPENLRFVIEFCEATVRKVQRALATDLAFD